jgi:hypothetical protein
MEQSVQSLAQEVEKQAQEILNLQLMLLMTQSRQPQQQIPAVDPSVRVVPMGPAGGIGGMSGPPGILRWSGGGSATALDEVSINYNSSDEVQINNFETGLPAATKSLAEILMGV